MSRANSGPAYRLCKIKKTTCVRGGNLTRPPGHQRNGRDAVGRCAVDQLAADRQIDQRPVRFIPHADNTGFLEQDRRILAENHSVFRQLVGERDRPRLATRQGKLRRILRQAKATAEPPRSRLADVASHAGYLRIIERFDTNLVIGSDQLPLGRHTPYRFRAGQRRMHDQPDKQRQSELHGSSSFRPSPGAGRATAFFEAILPAR